MRIFTRWLRRFWTFVKAWLLRHQPPYCSVEVEELPDELDARTLYVVGENGHRWFAAMLCPCVCGVTLHLNMLPDARPRWGLTEHRDGTVSLRPSVWRKKDCRSHFFLRRSRIEWSVDLPRARR